MNWFGGKKEKAMPMASAFREDDGAEREARHAALERAAIAAEPGVLAKIPAEYAANEDEHRRQVSGYKFECRRYGDFLTLFMERPVKDWRETEFSQRKMSTSVNIAATREIRLTAGHAPDFNGVVGYRINGCYIILPDGTRKEDEPVRAEYATADGTHRQLIALDEKRDGESHWGYRSGREHTNHCTMNFPRPAADDSIRFEGIGATVYAPFGLGQAVYDAILKEIEAYRDIASALAR